MHQQLQIGFAAAFDITEMKISHSKTEILHLSKNFVQFSLQVSGVSLKQVEKFKYAGVAFTSYTVEGKTKNWMFD